MDRKLQFYSYEICYESYIQRIASIRQRRIKGETIIAKPILLVAIIDGISANVFLNNLFSINDWLEEQYNKLMTQYARESQFEKRTGIEKPFWHLETDGFWHLFYQGDRIPKTHTPSKAWLKENLQSACLDDDLFVLLQNPEWRMKIRNFIIEHKLTRYNSD